MCVAGCSNVSGSFKSSSGLLQDAFNYCLTKRIQLDSSSSSISFLLGGSDLLGGLFVEGYFIIFLCFVFF